MWVASKMNVLENLDKCGILCGIYQYQYQPVWVEEEEEEYI